MDGVTEMFRKIGDGLRRFMAGRYGSDRLNQCLLGAALITSAELIVGVTVNIILGWNVWDYSDIPLNFMGQICLPYSVLWYFLCLPVVWGCSLLAKIF